MATNAKYVSLVKGRALHRGRVAIAAAIRRRIATPRILALAIMCQPGLQVATAQSVPDSMVVDWTGAGFRGAIPAPPSVLNVRDYGAAGDGTRDDAPAVERAIQTLRGSFGAIYFPPGRYLFRSTLVVPDSTVLRGDGPRSTILRFDFGGAGADCISFSGRLTSVDEAVVSGYRRGSTAMRFSNAAAFRAGDYLELQQRNGAWDTQPVTWAENSVGQMLRVVAVEGDVARFEPALRIDFDSSLSPVARAVAPCRMAGIECLRIERADGSAEGTGSNVSFSLAAECWMRGVESDHSAGSHVMISAGSGITISGCSFHDAFAYDGTATRGYGVLLIHHTSDCLVEDNVFLRLRHAMIAKQGANGNVFSYNYSREPMRVEAPADLSGDISLHGHYAFSNLFEGNIVQNIIVDHYWGPSGPRNTFFRNRAEMYGIWVVATPSNATSAQVFMGNEVTSALPLKGNYSLSGTGHFEYANSVRGELRPPGTAGTVSSSLYRAAAPPHWGAADPWPSIGPLNPPGKLDIPAKRRYDSGEELTVCGGGRLTEEARPVEFPLVGIDPPYPNPFSKAIAVPLHTDRAATVRIACVDPFGRVLHEEVRDVTPGRSELLLTQYERLLPRFFYLRVTAAGSVAVFPVLRVE